MIYAHFFVAKMIWAHLFCCKDDLHTLFFVAKTINAPFLSQKEFTHVFFVAKTIYAFFFVAKTIYALCPESFCALKVAIRKVQTFCASATWSKKSEGICQILSPSHSGLGLSKRFDLITQWTKSTVAKSQDRNASSLAIVPSNLLSKMVWWLRLQKSFFMKGRLQPNTIATRVDRMWA